MRPRGFARAKLTGLALLLVLAAACRPRESKVTPAAHHSPLPDRLGSFAGGPLTADEAAARRTYTRGDTRIEVTMARFPMSDAEYARWVRTSREAFPQASLGIPPEEANGFYQCTTGADPRCNLLVQLRSGVHVEIRGGDTARRADVDAIADQLPLRALANDAHILDELSRTHR